MMQAVLGAALLILSTTICGPSWAYDPHDIVLQPGQPPKEFEGIGITEKLGANVDLSLQFVGDSGEPLTLRQVLPVDRPTLFAMVYYECPTLCNLHLNGLTEVMRDLKLEVGKDFDVVAVSMNERETSDLAAAKKASYIKSYGRPGSAEGWHFLTGSKESIKTLADQIGFGFRWDEESKQFAHASATIALTSSGTISRYLQGVRPEPQDLKLAIIEASRGQVGTVIDKIVMFCFQFDPKKSKYTIYAWNIMRIGVVLTLLGMAVLLVPIWWRERLRGRPAA